ncbi:hypothetical protein [Streptomyces sp. NPDC053069]|uniref:hypothetical protein n=1 Tax=Streptomyces sp. NPDC053069 TaxID=3365695 RepID=UPI0037CDA795
MTTPSPSPRPHEALIPSVPVLTPSPQLLTWPATPPEPLPQSPDESPPDGPRELSAGTTHAGTAHADRPGEDTPDDGAPRQGDLPYDDPLQGLVRAAVADRPLEEVVRLITLLENSPEHPRATADALRAIGVDRPVEDLARLVALLTEPPRDTGSADEVIRAAAERRPLDEVARLVQLLHRASVEPHCGQAALQAAAANRPVEELAELIARLAADRPGHETLLFEPPLPASPPPVTSPSETPLPERSYPDPAALASAALASARPASAEPASAGPSLAKPSPAEPPSATPDGTPAATGGRGGPEPGPGSEPGPDRSAEGRPANGRPVQLRPAKGQGQDAWSSLAPPWGVRGAAVLVFLCGVAHAPRSWPGPSHGVLPATVLGPVLCVLLALALPARSPQARLVTATAALGLTAALAAGQLLGRWSGVPDPSRSWDATLAPPWLADTTAAVAALAALAVLLGTLVASDARRAGAG